MKAHRINALIRRHFLLTFRRPNRLFYVIYWPLINIALWGFTSIWIQNLIKEQFFAQSILIGLILWQIVFRVNIEIAKGLYEEIVQNNLVNLFSTPLSWSEWVIAMMVMGIINMMLVLTSSAGIVWLLYGISLTALGWYLVPFAFLLYASGCFIGFFICGLLIYWGMKAQDFLYSIGYLFAPFSAVFYPLSALPTGAQMIGNMLPTTAVFEAMREVVTTGSCSSYLLIKSFVLNVFYLFGSLSFFYWQFLKSKKKGLGRLE